jgi:probable rRNA maturation factor
MIEINNLTSHSIEEEFLKKIIREILKDESKKEVQLSFVFVGEERIKKLNKRYLKKNRITDVLAFPVRRTKSEKFKIGNSREIQFLGEIVICPQKVKKNSKRFKVTFKRELARVSIHGILHLLGYNHQKDKKTAEKMKEKENYYLGKFF